MKIYCVVGDVKMPITWPLFIIFG